MTQRWLSAVLQPTTGGPSETVRLIRSGHRRLTIRWSGGADDITGLSSNGEQVLKTAHTFQDSVLCFPSDVHLQCVKWFLPKSCGSGQSRGAGRCLRSGVNWQQHHTSGHFTLCSCPSNRQERSGSALDTSWTGASHCTDVLVTASFTGGPGGGWTSEPSR